MSPTLQNPNIFERPTTYIFGGSFDPPHLGHLQVVQELLRLPRSIRVVLLPATQSPLKGVSTPYEHRLEMLKLAFHELLKNESLEISTLQNTTTYEVLQPLRALYGDSLTFVIGTDQLFQLPKWFRFPEVLGLCHWLVLKRKAVNESHLPEDFLASWQNQGLVRLKDQSTQSSYWELPKSKILTLTMTQAPALSSTQIRQMLHLNQNNPELSAFLSPSVFDYLKAHGLYGMKS